MIGSSRMITTATITYDAAMRRAAKRAWTVRAISSTTPRASVTGAISEPNSSMERSSAGRKPAA